MSRAPQLEIPILSQSVIDRFWSKVAITANDEKCWEWQASKRGNGYGRFTITKSTMNKSSYISSRVAYYIKNNVDPIGKVIMHSCDNPSCVNPKHLSIGTYKENSIDREKKNRSGSSFKKGENNIKSKLNENEVREIRERYSNGNITQKELGKEYGTNGHYINSIINKKRWKHI